jgi:magnesium transporter
VRSEYDLCEAFIDAHPRDAAKGIERLPPPQAAALIDAISPVAAARAVSAMAPAIASDSLVRLSPERAASVMGHLRTDRAAVLLRLMPPAAISAILKRLPETEMRMLQARLQYPEGTAGALMDIRIVSGPDHLTAGAVLTLLRRTAGHLHDYFYVVDEEHRLAGAVDLRDVVVTRSDAPVSELMNRSVNRVPARAGRAAILASPGWKHVHALPVVDDTGVLVGAISYGTFRALSDDLRNGAGPADAMTTVVALGELYWLGLSGVVDGVAAAVRRAVPPGGPDAHARRRS